MIQKINSALSIAIGICFLLIIPVEIYYNSKKNVLTSNSFDKISFLNKEISKLKILEGKEYNTKAELIFKTNNIIEPKIFNEYRFLNDYLFSQEFRTQFVPKTSTQEFLKLGINASEINELTPKQSFGVSCYPNKLN